LRVKLMRLGEWTAARQRNAGIYRTLFADYGLTDCIELPFVSAGSEHVYNQFVIRTQERDRLREHLQQAGIPTEVYYPSPLHLQRAFSSLGYKPGDLAMAEEASQQVLALPIYPELGNERQVAVVESIAAFHAENSEVRSLSYDRSEA